MLVAQPSGTAVDGREIGAVGELNRNQRTRRGRRSLYGLLIAIGVAGVASAALIDMFIEDFHLSGTQILDVTTDTIWTSGNCTVCHGPYDAQNDPYSTWKGSLMGNSGRDPLLLPNSD